MKIEYQDFVDRYPKMYRNAKFYPEFLELRKKGLSIKEIKNRLKPKISEGTFRYWLNGSIPLPFKEFSKIKTGFDNRDLDYLAIIIGHTLGDGGITKQKFLCYCNTEEFLIDEFKYAIEKVFDTKPTVCYKEDSGVTRLVYPRLYSRILLCLFGEFSLGKDSKKITPQINKMPLEWKIKLIRAWYDDDGSAPDAGCYKCVAFKQKDKKLISWIQKISKEVGINSKLSKDGNRWHLRILNYLNMVKFKDKIGFSKGYRKQLHLEKLIREAKCPHWRTKFKILELIKKRPRKSRELVDILKIDRTVLWHHLFGSNHKERINTPGLIDMSLVYIKKEGRLNLYSLNKKEYNKFIVTLDKEEIFKQKRK